MIDDAMPHAQDTATCIIWNEPYTYLVVCKNLETASCGFQVRFVSLAAKGSYSILCQIYIARTRYLLIIQKPVFKQQGCMFLLKRETILLDVEVSSALLRLPYNNNNP